MTRPYFEPSINLGHVLTIVSILISVAGSATIIVSRQVALESQQQYLVTEIQKIESQYQRRDVTDELRASIQIQLTEIREELQSLNKSLR